MTKMSSDLLGRQFGELRVESFIGIDYRGKIWACVCDCGRKAIRSSKALLASERQGQAPCCQSCLEELRGGLSADYWSKYHETRKQKFRELWHARGSLYGDGEVEVMTDEIREAVGAELGGWTNLAEVVPMDPVATQDADEATYRTAVANHLIDSSSHESLSRPVSKAYLERLSRLANEDDARAKGIPMTARCVRCIIRNGITFEETKKIVSILRRIIRAGEESAVAAQLSVSSPWLAEMLKDGHWMPKTSLSGSFAASVASLVGIPPWEALGYADVRPGGTCPRCFADLAAAIELEDAA